MVAFLMIDVLLIAFVFFVFWRFFGGHELYLQVTYDQTAELRTRIGDIGVKIAELPSADGTGVTSPAVEFLRGELEKDSRRLEVKLDLLGRE